MRRVHSILLWLVVSGLLINTSACDLLRPSSKAAKVSRELAESITRSATSSQPDKAKSTAAIEEQRVFIDASQSMAGFAQSKEKNSTFHELLNSIGDVMPGCLLYKYGLDGANQPQNISQITERTRFGSEIHGPAFYKKQYNPDDFLINTLAEEDRPALSVLITDGVYSEPEGSTSPPVVEAVQHWLERGRVVGILIFKSAYTGKFYSEKNRGWLPPFSVASRPFYAFVFSPTDQAFRELQGRLHRRFPEMGTILFSNDIVDSRLELAKGVKDAYSARQPPDADYYWQMFDAGVFDQKNPEVVYKIRYLVSPDYPATEFEPNISTDYYRWEKGVFKKVDAKPPDGFQCQLVPGSMTADPVEKAKGQASPTPVASTIPSQDFTVHLAKDQGSDFSFYHLKLNTAVKSWRQDIIDLSTRDDSLPANASKTYRFYELITALTDVHFKTRLAQRTAPELFVTVANH
jgi:hypothetical protein